MSPLPNRSPSDLEIAIERLKEGWDSVGINVDEIPPGSSEDEIISRIQSHTGLTPNEEVITWFRWQGGHHKMIWLPNMTLPPLGAALDLWEHFAEVQSYDPDDPPIDTSFIGSTKGSATHGPVECD